MSVEATTPASAPAPAPVAPASPAHEPTLAEKREALKASPKLSPKGQPDAAGAADMGSTPPAVEAVTSPPEGEAQLNAEPPKDERFSRAFAKLADEKKQHDARTRKFSEEQKAFADKAKAYEEHQSSIELLRANPVEWLQKHGGTDTVVRINKWLIEGSGQAPVEERITAAEARAKAAEDAIAKAQTDAAERSHAAAAQATLARYKADLSTQYTDADRQIAAGFGIADLGEASLEFAKAHTAELRAQGFTTDQIDNELTHDKIAGKVRDRLQAELAALKGNAFLQNLFGPPPAPAVESTPKPPQKSGTQLAQPIRSLTNALTATTDISPSDLSLEEKRRRIKARYRG